MHWRERSQRRRAINEPGHAHEFTFSCYHRFRFLEKERTCEWLADAINEARVEFSFELWVYVFMPEHVHLIVYLTQPTYDVSDILKAIKEPVGRKAIGFLRRSAPAWLPKIRVFHPTHAIYRFWEAGGGYDRNVIVAETLMSMVEYIHYNPVRRGLVLQPEDWKWSSAAWLLGRQPNSLRPDPIPPGWGVIEYPCLRCPF